MESISVSEAKKRKIVNKIFDSSSLMAHIEKAFRGLKLKTNFQSASEILSDDQNSADFLGLF